MQSFGPVFVNTIKLKHPLKPMFEWGWSQETEAPYRKSKVCLVFWVPFVPVALAVGLWGEKQTREEAYKAMGLREIAKFSNLPVGSISRDGSEW